MLLGRWVHRAESGRVGVARVMGRGSRRVVWREAGGARRGGRLGVRVKLQRI